MKLGFQTSVLTTATPAAQPATARTAALKQEGSRPGGEQPTRQSDPGSQFSVLVSRLPAGSRLPVQPPHVSARSVVWKVARVAGKALLGLGLALLTINLIAMRMYNLPSAPDPVFGDVHEPGKRFCQQIEGNGSGVWTSNCVRRASLPPAGQKPALLILGDSYTEAIQVGDKDHFAHLLEQRLGGVSVLAMGRSGYSVADYVAGAVTFKRLFEPDRVIIQVGAADFEADAWTRKEGGYAYFKRPQPSAQVLAREPPRSTDASAVSSGSLKVVSLPVSRPGWLSTVTREKCPFWFPLVTFAYLRKSELNEWMEGNNRPWFHAATAKPREEGLQGKDTETYPLDDEMKLLSEAYAGRLMLLYLPKFDPAHPSKETETEKALYGLAEKYGVQFVSLREKFPELAAAGHAPYGFSNTRFNWGHWNRYGHQAAAELLFAECQRLGVNR